VRASTTGLAPATVPRSRTASGPDPADPDPEPEPGDLEAALAAARAGAEWAFVALYRHLQPRLLRYATVLAGADAEDITADTWLHVARDLHRFDGDLDGFRGWASTICRNRAVDVARLRARRPAVVADVMAVAEPAAAADTADDALGGMASRAALAVIATLPRHQAEAVLLRAVVGLDAPAAAKVLGRTPGAVRVAAHRGLKTLARQLAGGVTPAAGPTLEGPRCAP
jgi:RNA polymerase sigma-70 factor, ECF subfamily